MVGVAIEFSIFKWEVGERFTTRKKDFREAIAKYDIFQGRIVEIDVSNKARDQRVGVNCQTTCRFRLYASLDILKIVYML